MYRTNAARISAVCLVLAGLCVARADDAEDQFTVAAKHYTHARWKLAVAEFTSYLTQFPAGTHVDRVTFYLGESLVQLKQFDLARERFAHFCEHADSSELTPRAHFRMGEMSYLLGDSVRADRDLTRFRDEESMRGLPQQLCTFVAVFVGVAYISST